MYKDLEVRTVLGHKNQLGPHPPADSMVLVKGSVGCCLKNRCAQVRTVLRRIPLVPTLINPATSPGQYNDDAFRVKVQRPRLCLASAGLGYC